jgi:hypothetical protein
MALTTTRAFLACVSWIDFDDGYTRKASFVPQEGFQLVESPLALLRVSFDLGIVGCNAFKILDRNGPTMLLGVVHNSFAGSMVFIRCTTCLLPSEFVYLSPSSLRHKLGFTPTKIVFERRSADPKNSNGAVLRIRESRYVPHRVPVDPDAAFGLDWICTIRLIADVRKPFAAPVKELHVANESMNGMQERDGYYGFFKECWYPYSSALNLNLFSLVATNWQNNIPNLFALWVPLILNDQAFR